MEIIKIKENTFHCYWLVIITSNCSHHVLVCFIKMYNV